MTLKLAQSGRAWPFVCIFSVLAAAGSPAAAQTAVPTVSTREATRATGSTGYGGAFRPSPVPTPMAWPAPNGGRGWGVLGGNLGAAGSDMSKPLGSHYEPSGLVAATPQAPQYHVDTLGNFTYVGQSGAPQTYGTTIQSVNGRR